VAPVRVQKWNYCLFRVPVNQPLQNVFKRSLDKIQGAVWELFFRKIMAGPRQAIFWFVELIAL
jgi:hypothetical protein